MENLNSSDLPLDAPLKNCYQPDPILKTRRPMRIAQCLPIGHEAESYPRFIRRLKFVTTSKGRTDNELNKYLVSAFNGSTDIKSDTEPRQPFRYGTRF